MWKPSIKEGIIGQQGVRAKRSTAGDAVPQPYGGEDEGRAKYYVNPNSFTGLHGFQLDRPGYAKSYNYKTPLAGSAGIMSRKDEPYDA